MNECDIVMSDDLAETDAYTESNRFGVHRLEGKGKAGGQGEMR